MAGNCIGTFLLTLGIGVCQLLAVFPDQVTVPVHLCPTSIVIRVTAKAEHPRTGRCIQSSPDIGIVDIDDVLTAAHVSVVDPQRLLTKTVRIHSAVDKVNPNVMFSCTVIRVNIDCFSRCIEGAVIKCHGRGAIRPDRITEGWSIEGRIDKLCTGIAPIGCPAVDFAVIHHCFVNIGKAQIIFIAGAKLHIFEGDCSGIFKAVIAVILCAIKLRVRHLRTDLPGRFVRSLPHKGQVFSHGRIGAVNLIQCIFALAKDDGITALGRYHSILQLRKAPRLTVDLYRMRVGCAIRKSQHGKHLKHHCHCQQGSQKPVLTFLFQLSSFLSSLFAFLQRIPRKEPSRFLPHCHLPCRFHFPHCRSQPGC